VNNFTLAGKFFIRIALLMAAIIIFISLVPSILLVLEFSKISYTSTHFSQAVNFLDSDKTLFINTATWGVAGNHYYIYFSDSKKESPDKDRDLIFYRLSLFYKAANDELIIWTDRNVNLEPESIIFNGIKTQINYFSSREIDELKAKHKELGLFMASVYDGITPP
jgi:hypothetical protein